MTLSSFQARIVPFVILALALFADYSYAMDPRHWGTPNAGLYCDGAPRTVCDFVGGGGGGLSNGPECNDAAENMLALGDLVKAVALFKNELDTAIRDKNLSRQVACLQFLGLASKRQALQSSSVKDRKAILDITIGWYRQLIDIDPNNMEALQALLSIYEERGENARAEETRRRIKNVEGATGRSSCINAGKVQPKLAEGVLIPGFALFASSRESCSIFKLAPTPKWTFSGILTDAGSLFLADPRENIILHYKLPQEGRPNEIKSFEHFKSPILAPSTLGLTDDGYILQYGKNLLSLQNKENTTVWQIDVTAGAQSSIGSVTSLSDWTVADDYLFGFSDVRFSNGVFKSGLFKSPIGNLSSFAIVPGVTLDLEDPEAVFYWGGFRYLTSIASRAYFLAMEKLPAIYEVETHKAKPRLIYRFAEAYKRPGLPSTSQGFEKFLDAVSKATMPVGLYSIDRLLYVVMRISRGSTVDWELFKIDPIRGVLLSRKTLPVHSKHLVVIQGAKFWGFLEKGDYDAVDGPRQDIGNLWLIPVEMIKGERDVCPALESVAKLY